MLNRTFSHPRFTTKWLKSEAEVDFVKELFIEECQRTITRNDEKGSDVDDFFSYSQKAFDVSGISYLFVS